MGSSRPSSSKLSSLTASSAFTMRKHEARNAQRTILADTLQCFSLSLFSLQFVHQKHCSFLNENDFSEGKSESTIIYILLRHVSAFVYTVFRYVCCETSVFILLKSDLGIFSTPKKNRRPSGGIFLYIMIT